MKFNGQVGQDYFVLKCLNFKKNGTFLEIGSNHPIDINNSYLLERDYNWTGYMVEYESRFLPLYKQHRPASKYIISDATKVDYKKACSDLPENIRIVCNEAVSKKINISMSNTFGFGGHNAIVIFKKIAD